MSVLSKLFGASTASGVGPVDAQDLLGAGAPLVDVREKAEWDAGHAPKAKHRSARATKMLTRAGFDAVNLTGGMTAWERAGLPMVNSRGKRGSVR